MRVVSFRVRSARVESFFCGGFSSMIKLFNNVLFFKLLCMKMNGLYVIFVWWYCCLMSEFVL